MSSKKLCLVINPSKGRKLIITDEMRASLERLDFASLSDEESAGDDSGTPSPSPSTQEDSSPSPPQPAALPALEAPAAPQRPQWPPGSSDEEPEDDAYDILHEVAFEDFQLINGTMQSCLPNNPRKYDGLLGLKPRAKGESKEVYMASCFLNEHLYLTLSPLFSIR